MRVITLNCNGIRSAHKKGLFQWLAEADADIIKLQEVRADLPILQDVCRLDGYTATLNPAEKKGYSGTAILSKYPPIEQRIKVDIDVLDSEGRWTEITCSNIRFISIYVPSGSSKEAAQQKKEGVLLDLKTHLKKLIVSAKESGSHVIISGDWNIAHTEKDIKNWRANQKNSGFLPHERAWLTDLFVDWVDVYRQLYPEAEGTGYSWWSNRGNAWQNNVGWRLDYQLATPEIAGKAVTGFVYKTQKFSDHAPVVIDYCIDLMA